MTLGIVLGSYVVVRKDAGRYVVIREGAKLLAVTASGLCGRRKGKHSLLDKWLKRFNLYVVFALLMIILLLVPFTLLLASQNDPVKPRRNIFPSNITMELAPPEMLRSASCTGASVLARVNVNASTAYWFPALCRVPSGWQIWDGERLVWSLLKRVEAV